MVEPDYSCPQDGGACTISVLTCGNARLDAGEQCDDGQSPMSDGDGCSKDCKVENGFVCAQAGQACERIYSCGDGIISYARGETCDDKQNPPLSNDGCSNKCTVEAGYRCTGSPSRCEYTIVCGNKRIDKGEQCDDGNATSNDGCSATCQRETGFDCNTVGRPCQAICGDGVLLPVEVTLGKCDDGNTRTGDGCSQNCTVEPQNEDNGNGWVCATAGSACTRTVCGDGIVQGSEQCDDGNKPGAHDMGDGCSPFCHREPSCPTNGGPCSTACGDGILLQVDKANGQECDDGNTISGDGCSANCKVETGYLCSDERLSPTTLKLPIVYRDFKAANQSGNLGTPHPDFQTFNGAELGIVQDRLGADGKPKHVLTNRNTTANTYNNGVLAGTDYFDIWYRDNPTYNLTFVETLSLARQANDTYKFTDHNFYPLTNRGFGNYYNDRNYHFTSEVRYWFEYSGGESLQFMGDDDVWVFVNKRLAVDLGGIHVSHYGSVTLDNNGNGAICQNQTTETPCSNPTTINFGLVRGNVYEIVVFQAERNVTESNYTLTLGNFNAVRSNCRPDCGDGHVTGSEQCDFGRANNKGGYGGCNANCTLAAYCGDGNISDGELCDDGINGTPYGSLSSGCAPDCQPNHYCGDSKLDSDFGEACDKGPNNGAASYGEGACTNECKVGPFCGDGYVNGGTETCDQGVANGSPTSRCDKSCHSKCGNGVIDPSETCDRGTGKNIGGYNGCLPNCRLGAYCGDGVKDIASGEECDDGKNDGSYGTCAPGCKHAAYCGDGHPDQSAGEKCDAGDSNVSNKYGRDLCTTGCRPAPFCGDGAVDSAFNEKCDDGADNGTQPGTCKEDCSGYNAAPISCGNGHTETGEDCDDGANNGKASSLCDARCKYKCGNGIKDAGEQCDNGTNNGSYGTCRPDCSLADYCGDGKVNGAEQCDKGEANSNAAYGSDKCSASCKRAPYCGDGRVTAPEACDSQAGCLKSCLWDTTGPL